jgi:hypothetical protein
MTPPKIAKMAILMLLMAPEVSFAQSKTPAEISLLRTLNQQLMEWFNSLSSSFDSLADNEDRRALRSRLVDLNKAIYDLESNGRYLLYSIRRKPILYEDVTRAIRDTRTALETLRTGLRATGLSLRMEYRKGGADAERLIAEAMGHRSMWLSDLDSAIANRKITPELVAEGTNILNMQGTASMALSGVIEKLAKTEDK